MNRLPDSPRLTNEARDKQIAEQATCGRKYCARVNLTHYNTGTDLMYCTPCANRINQHWPGLCIPYDRTAKLEPSPGAKSAPEPLPAVTRFHPVEGFEGLQKLRDGEPERRVRLSAVKVDIENAFSAWQSREANTGNGSGFNESLRAESRVNAFLAQVEADRKQLHDALAACRALDEANNDVDVRQATKLARIALAHPGP